eukprot:2767699-Prymnesium_polylepis.1
MYLGHTGSRGTGGEACLQTRLTTQTTNAPFTVGDCLDWPSNTPAPQASAAFLGTEIWAGCNSWPHGAQPPAGVAPRVAGCLVLFVMAASTLCCLAST